MFEDLKAAFREALENFDKELKSDHVPESVDRLIVGMRNEVADTKVLVSELESQIEKSVALAGREQSEAATARRRERMALDINDAETAQVAGQYAEKHEERHRVLEQKVVALRAELKLCTAEVEEMLEKVKEAQAKRSSLGATAGRAGARDSIGAADDLFSELDRMAEKMQGEGATADAAESFSEIDFGSESEMHVDMDQPPRREVDVDARLAELKRRMGKDE